MRKLLAGLVVGLAAVLVAASMATAGHTTQAKTVKFSAALNKGQEVPSPKGTKIGASGRFTATLTGTTLTWKLTFAHLTGAATAAHIHDGVKGKSGPVLFPLCGPCTSGVHGTTTLTAAQITAMMNRKYYVNVHTAKNPGGEIRGQITRAM
jgi:hypothetical protein